MATHFVPTEEIQKLTQGSYEYLASKIDEAISKDAKKVFGESVPNKIERIGTFGEHVLVAADDGRFAKVKYEQVNGVVTIVSAEPVTVPLYTDSNVSSYLMKEARSVVDSVLAHDGAQAEVRLRGLIPFVEESQAPSEESIVASIIENITADRPWKRLYEQRNAQVREFLGETLKGIEERKLPIKFAKLMDGSVPLDQQESYRTIVNTDLSFLAESLGNWIKLIESVDDVKTAQASIADPTTQKVVTTFLAFAEDLKLNIQHVRESVLEAVRIINSIPCLGSLYDALAEESFHYEVASQFASAMLAALRPSK